jgi:hypothetical protein
MPSIPPDPPVTDIPIYWFAKLERAVEEGDHATAAEAQRELARLGVQVAYGQSADRKAVARAD